MNFDFYSSTSAELSALLTKRYSTSFSLGISAFAPRFRRPIYSLYGFVRIADEIVDTFHNADQAALLDDFAKQTYAAIEQRVSANPILHAFQEIYHRYKIDKEYIDAFLESMRMDLSHSYYDASLYDKYVYGSAEVVGLMCLKIFTEGDDKRFDELAPAAKALGSAFQKVNFLRDMKSDYQARGRIYLPDVSSFDDMTDIRKAELELAIEAEFEQALAGIKQLPNGVAFGVYLAYVYYRKLFNKIRDKRIEHLLVKRVRISNPRKLLLFLSSYLRVRLLRLNPE
jgi:phytoene/squalene synthetase